MSLIKDIFKSVERALLGEIIGAIEGALSEGANRKSVSKFQPGDVELIDIILMSDDQERAYSLMTQCVGFDVYESILSPVMFAELTIADSTGLLQNFPINGGEYVKLSFKTPQNKGAPVQYLMRVNRIENKQVNESNKKITYTLQCVSAELLTNSKSLVSFKVEATISDIINNILSNDLQTAKPRFIDPTAGIEKLLITRMTPFQAIDFVRQKAVSSQYQSSSFCFYENRKGFNFTTIERLFEQGAKDVESGTTDKIFFFDTSRKDSAENVTMRNIIAYNQMQFADTMSQIKSGGLNNQVQQFDIITGDVKKVTYTDNIGADQFKASSSTSANKNQSSFVSNHGRTTTVTKIVPARSDKPATELAEKLTKTRAYAQKIAQNIVQIHIYGDSDVNIGDVIECRFPSGSDDKANAGMSRLDSGNYLVSKIRHIVLNTDRPQYTQALELIKGDLQEVTQ